MVNRHCRDFVMLMMIESSRGNMMITQLEHRYFQNSNWVVLRVSFLILNANKTVRRMSRIL
jgi:hypothetical protein